CFNEKKHIQIDVPDSVSDKVKFFKTNVLKNTHHTDSLSMKSFDFILDNIKYQKSKRGKKYEAYRDVINKYFNNDDSLVVKFKALYDNYGDDETYDVLTMDEESLINDIEEALRIYSESNWKDEMSFETLGQYVLPYKANKQQPFENGWRHKLLSAFIEENGDSIFDKDIGSAATQPHKWLYDKKGRFRVFFANDNLGIPDLS